MEKMNLSNSQLQLILAKANFSPSGDNSQPWSYVWNQVSLQIFHNSARAQHPLNPQGIASMISLGMLLTAVQIAASEFGFSTTYQLGQMNPENNDFWAQVHFIQTQEKISSLADVLETRSTDRRPYISGNLDRKRLKEPLSQQSVFFPATWHSCGPPSSQLLDYISNAEQLLTDDPHILPATLKWLRFTHSQVQKTKDGMHWSNMGVKFWELPSIPLIRDFPMALKLLRPIVKSQNKFRIEDQLKSSSELICVSIPDSTQSSLNKSTIVKAGGLMMELWLSLNKMGFGVQPLTIVSTFAFSIKHGLSPASTKWKHFFETGEALLKNEFSIATNNTPIWIVRTGKSPGLSISMRTLRMAPILKIIE